MAVDIAEVKRLKDLTGVGLTDAKKALEEAHLLPYVDPYELQRLEAAARFAFTQKTSKLKRGTRHS